MCGECDCFKNHLAQIKFAKAPTSEIITDLELPTETAMASLSRAWEMLFDSICVGMRFRWRAQGYFLRHTKNIREPPKK
jgi:hypothetical protein